MIPPVQAQSTLDIKVGPVLRTRPTKIQNPSIWKTLKFDHETILVQIGFTGVCV
jgi:hypothetical protein